MSTLQRWASAIQVLISATPQHCGQPNRLLSWGLKKVVELRLRTFKNLISAIPQFSAVSCQFHYFLVPFPQLRIVLKINQGYFKNCLFLLKTKLALKGELHEIFTSSFFMNGPNSTAKNMTKIAEVKLSSCGLQKKLRVMELQLQSNISSKRYGIAIAEVLPSSCGIAIADSKKSCPCPPLPP
jgi:hypothetical protein